VAQLFINYNTAKGALAMKLRVLFLSLVLVVASALVIASDRVVEAQDADGTQQRFLLIGVPVSGALSDGGTFEGTMSITGFGVDEAGQLVAEGLLRGTATMADGSVREIRFQRFQNVGLTPSPGAAVEGEEQRCRILLLDIRPIFLDLLGLEVSLSRVTLDITAVRGESRLLGNLLCAIAGLLDPS
jgi:hypothetical protein